MNEPGLYRFARLGADLADVAEAETVSATFRSLFHSNLKLTRRKREDHLRKGLAKLGEDVDKVLAAIGEIDPEGPPPEPDEEEDGPIRLSTLSPVGPFPIEVLPGVAQELAVSIAEAVQAPVDFAGVAILAVTSIAIGRSAVFRIKEEWEVQAALYTAMIGRSSDGKSSSLKKAAKPMDDIQLAEFKEYEARHRDWSAIKEKDRGAEPTPSRIITTDSTREAMAGLLAAHRRGIGLRKDEMIGWLASFDEYHKGGGGSDLAFFLSGWDGDLTIVDRSKHKGAPLIIPRPFITIIGGMVPSSIGQLAGDGNHSNGLMQRILYCYPNRLPAQRWGTAGVSRCLMASWRALVDRLRGRTALDGEDYSEPHVATMSEPAAAAWAAWGPRNLAEKNDPGMTESLASTWGKMEDQLGRLTLILHLLRLAEDPEASPTGPVPPVDAATVDAAIRLIEYFKSHARRVFGAYDATRTDRRTAPPLPHIQAIQRYAKNHPGDEVISRRDISRANSAIFGKDKAALDDALSYLERKGVLAKVVVEKKSMGRPPGASYRVVARFRDDCYDDLLH